MEVLRSEWQVLVGFWDEATALNFARGQGVSLSTEGFEALKVKIDAARDYAGRLPDRRNDLPEILPFSQSEAESVKELEAEATFQEHIQGMRKWEFGWVELSKALVFQPSLNTSYVDSLVKLAPSEDRRLETIHFCLPQTKKAASKLVTQGFDSTSNTFSIVTDNLDFRILGQVQGEEQESGRKFAGFAYGGGLPQMSVVEYRGRFFLKNGYHRAFALHKAGHRRVPCLVLHTDNYAMTGAQAAGFFALDTMLSERAPRLEDFDSSAAVPIPRRILRVMITVHAERVIFAV